MDETTSQSARRWELAAMTAAALALRAGLAWMYLLIHHITWDHFVTARDGEQFVAYVRALLDPSVTLDPYVLRFFPGYPTAAAGLCALGASSAVALLACVWIPAALVSPLAAVVTRSRRVGWMMVVFTPGWVLSIIPGMEPLSLALTLAALAMATTRRQPGTATGVAAGCLFGLAGLVRPMASYAVAAVMLAAGRRRRWPLAASVAGVSLAVVIAGLVLVGWRFGDPLASYHGYTGSARAYGEGGLAKFPFASLVLTPLRDGVPLWKIGYVYVHVAFALLACGMMVRPWWRAWRGAKAGAKVAGNDSQVVLVLGPWAWIGTLATLCIGDQWGFHEFPRFIIPFLPALLYPYRTWLTGRRWRWLWAVAAAASVALAWVGLVKSF
jgi:hypothetical protein